MDIGIKVEHQKAITDILYANERVEKVILFGSRARGEYKNTSDIDIAIVGKELTLSDQARLAEALEELPIAQFTDLVRYDAIESDDLREQIDKYGVELDFIKSDMKLSYDKHGEALKKLAEF